MNDEVIFLICPKCFEVCEDPPGIHRHQRSPIECHPGAPGDERRKPPTNELGYIITRAPRWYLEARGIIAK